MQGRLAKLCKSIKKDDDPEGLLQKVQEIVYGTADLTKRDWNSRYRIDDFEMSERGFRLCVGDRNLRITYHHHTIFLTRRELRLVA